MITNLCKTPHIEQSPLPGREDKVSTQKLDLAVQTDREPAPCSTWAYLGTHSANNSWEGMQVLTNKKKKYEVWDEEGPTTILISQGGKSPNIS